MSQGRFYRHTVKTRRHCTNCRAPILKGQDCIVFRHGDGMFKVEGNLCLMPCASGLVKGGAEDAKENKQTLYLF